MAWLKVLEDGMVINNDTVGTSVNDKRMTVSINHEGNRLILERVLRRHSWKTNGGCIACHNGRNSFVLPFLLNVGVEDLIRIRIGYEGEL